MSKALSSTKQVQKLRKAIQKSIAKTQEDVNEQTVDIINTFTQNVVTIILEAAVLKVGYLRSQTSLLNFEQHSKFIAKKLQRDPEEFRPDIMHQSLLTLMDCPMNKAGCLRILINTEDDQVIEINPKTKIPRTFKRFSGMLAKLLETGKIEFEGQVLLEILPGKVQDNLPEKCHVVGTSYQGKLVNLKEYIKGKDQLAIVVGAVARGHPGLECKYAKESISISRYQLSTTNCLSKITDVFEQCYNII